MLETIHYPNQLNDIVVVGFLHNDARTFTIRPKLHGHFTLFIWPSFYPESDWVYQKDVFFPGQNSAPVRIIFNRKHRQLQSVDPWDLSRYKKKNRLRKSELQSFSRWNWAVIRNNRSNHETSIADAVFGPHAIARGEIEFSEEVPDLEEKTLVWSCNQPYETVDEKGQLHPYTTDIMDWYANIFDTFLPNTVWGLGDTGYSDGTDATNFADQVYNHAGWHKDPALKKRLYDAYRNMYRYHFSFDDMQKAMRSFPHLLSWDDHEIRDGWGSENMDFQDGNLAMFQIAREAASEYILHVGPRVNKTGDAHQAYMSSHQANFIFDTRTSRNYADPNGRIISQKQLDDFKRFTQEVAKNKDIQFYFLGSSVPFVHLKDIIQRLGSISPKTLTDVAGGVRDDIRDSWHSPGNKEALKQIINELRDLLWKRPDLHIINVSGDIHVANAFEIWPPGFIQPIYQVTSSALTNREHMPDIISSVAGVNEIELSAELGFVRRVWPEITDPNVLCISTSADHATLELQVLPVDNSKNKNQTLALS